MAPVASKSYVQIRSNELSKLLKKWKIRNRRRPRKTAVAAVLYETQDFTWSHFLQSVITYTTRPVASKSYVQNRSYDRKTAALPDPRQLRKCITQKITQIEQRPLGDFCRAPQTLLTFLKAKPYLYFDPVKSPVEVVKNLKNGAGGKSAVGPVLIEIRERTLGHTSRIQNTNRMAPVSSKSYVQIRRYSRNKVTADAKVAVPCQVGEVAARVLFTRNQRNYRSN